MPENFNVKFSYMWRKLTITPKGCIFTTIRSYNPQKLTYYEAKQGKILDMLLTLNIEGAPKARTLFTAKLLQVVVIVKPQPALLEYDADNKQEWIDKINANEKNILLILQRVS